MPEDTPRTPFELPDDGKAFPKHLVELLWWHLKSARDLEFYGRPGSRQQLQVLVGHAFQASLQSEEGRPVRFQLLFEQVPQQVTIPFGSPLDYNPQQLVRLAPTIGLGFRWIVVGPSDPTGDALQIVGICDPELSPPETAPRERWGNGLHFYMSSVVGLTIAALGPGNVRVTTGGGWSCQLQHGNIRLPITPHRIVTINDWFTEAGKLLGTGNGVAAPLVRRTWTSILKKVADARHGGCFLIVPDTFQEDSDKLKIQHRLNSSRFRDALIERLAVEPQLSRHVRGQQDDIDVLALDDAPFLERSVARMADFVASLTAVDGAVVIRRNLAILGFGAEIVQVGRLQGGEDVDVDFGRHPSLQGQASNIRSLSSFGMRHRSAIRFCQDEPGAIAIVVSQDGAVRVFFSAEARAQGRDVVAEDWIMP